MQSSLSHIVVGAGLLALTVGGVFAQVDRDPTDRDRANRQSARAHALEFDEPHATFGDRYQRSVVEHEYRFTNTSSKPVNVLDVVVVSGDADLEVVPDSIAPGADGVVKLRQPLRDRLGAVAFRYAILTDEADGGARHRFTLSGFVQSAYDPEVPVLDFGVVDRALGGTAEFALFSREIERLALRGVTEAPPYMEITEPGRAGVAEEGLSLLASLSPGAPEGYVSGVFTLKTNVPTQPELLVQWRAIVAGDVMPVENPINLGMADIGYELRKELRLVSRTGRPFEVARLESDDTFEFAIGPCLEREDPDDGLCRSIAISWTPLDRQRLGGTIRVYVAGQESPISVRYRGMSVPPGTEVKELAPAGAFGDGNP